MYEFFFVPARERFRDVRKRDGEMIERCIDSSAHAPFPLLSPVSLSQEYRIDSHLDGIEEFARYSGDTEVSKSEWIQRLSEPPRA